MFTPRRLGLAAALLCGSAPSAFADLLGKPAPEIEFTNAWNASGEKALKDLQGRAVLLEVFTTW